jgi:hypothetical protein
MWRRLVLLVGYRRLGEACSLHRQDWIWTLQMETKCSSETSVYAQQKYAVAWTIGSKSYDSLLYPVTWRRKQNNFPKGCDLSKVGMMDRHSAQTIFWLRHSNALGRTNEATCAHIPAHNSCQKTLSQGLRQVEPLAWRVSRTTQEVRASCDVGDARFESRAILRGLMVLLSPSGQIPKYL